MYNFYCYPVEISSTLVKWVLLNQLFLFQAPFLPKPKTGSSGRFFLLLSPPPFGQPNANIFIHRFILYVLHTLASLVRAFQNTPFSNYKPKIVYHLLSIDYKMRKKCYWIKENEHVLKCFMYKDMGKNDFVQTRFLSVKTLTMQPTPATA